MTTGSQYPLCIFIATDQLTRILGRRSRARCRSHANGTRGGKAQGAAPLPSVGRGPSSCLIAGSPHMGQSLAKRSSSSACPQGMEGGWGICSKNSQNQCSGTSTRTRDPNHPKEKPKTVKTAICLQSECDRHYGRHPSKTQWLSYIPRLTPQQNTFQDSSCLRRMRQLHQQNTFQGAGWNVFR